MILLIMKGDWADRKEVKWKVANEKMVNIGTPERPILVPQKSLEPNTDKGREWWGMVAEGSVVLEPEKLDRLLRITYDKKS